MSAKKRAAAPAFDAPEEGERQREYTVAPTVGGSFDQDGTCLQAGGIPELDEHRMKKPER